MSIKIELPEVSASLRAARRLVLSQHHRIKDLEAELLYAHEWMEGGLLVALDHKVGKDARCTICRALKDVTPPV